MNPKAKIEWRLSGERAGAAGPCPASALPHLPLLSSCHPFATLRLPFPQRTPSAGWEEEPCHLSGPPRCLPAVSSPEFRLPSGLPAPP